MRTTATVINIMIVPVSKCSLTVMLTTPQASATVMLGVAYPVTMNIPVSSGTLPPM